MNQQHDQSNIAFGVYRDFSPAQIFSFFWQEYFQTHPSRIVQRAYQKAEHRTRLLVGHLYNQLDSNKRLKTVDSLDFSEKPPFTEPENRLSISSVSTEAETECMQEEEDSWSCVVMVASASLPETPTAGGVSTRGPDALSIPGSSAHSMRELAVSADQKDVFSARKFSSPRKIICVCGAGLQGKHFWAMENGVVTTKCDLGFSQYYYDTKICRIVPRKKRTGTKPKERR